MRYVELKIKTDREYSEAVQTALLEAGFDAMQIDDPMDAVDIAEHQELYKYDYINEEISQKACEAEAGADAVTITLYFPDDEEGYIYLIELYLEEGRTEDVSALLASCTQSSVLNKYARLLPAGPVFYPDEGVYNTDQEIAFSTEVKGKIYYTTDGSMPDMQSNKYNGTVAFNTSGNISRKRSVPKDSTSCEGIKNDKKSFTTTVVLTGE